MKLAIKKLWKEKQNETKNFITVSLDLLQKRLYTIMKTILENNTLSLRQI